MAEATNLQETVLGKFAIVSAYYRECFPPKLVHGKPVLNPKTKKPITIRVIVAGFEVEDEIHGKIRYPLSFRGASYGTFGEMRPKIKKDECGMPDGIEDGTRPARWSFEAMEKKIRGLAGEEANKLLAIVRG